MMNKKPKLSLAQQRGIVLVRAAQAIVRDHLEARSVAGGDVCTPLLQDRYYLLVTRADQGPAKLMVSTTDPVNKVWAELELQEASDLEHFTAAELTKMRDKPRTSSAGKDSAGGVSLLY